MIHVFVVMFVVTASVRSAPTSPPSMKTQHLPPVAALNFMKQFGYLEKGTPDSEALYSEGAIIDALKTVQKFGGINETGVVDNATLQLMASKRCGVPDLHRSSGERRKRFVIGSAGWKKRGLTYFIANWTPKVGQEAVTEQIRRAFDSWSGYARLTFTQVYDNNADIVIVFGRGYHGDQYAFDGPGSILAHAYFPYEMGHLGGDMHFDEDENWTSKPEEHQDGVDLFTVAVHELGHSLGLAHSPVHESIMFPYYKGHQPNFQIAYDDILAMYELYISKVLEGDGSRVELTTSRVEVATQTTTEDDTVATSHSAEEEVTTPRVSDGDTPTFEGDVETVDEHKNHGKQPNICEGNVDAIAVLRGELFVFKGTLMWRLAERGEVMDGYPVPFREMFSQLPPSITKIDAVYERPTDQSIVLFSGKEYWVYDGRSLIERSPRPLTDYGLPKHLTKVDAAQIWGKNGKLFLYSGNQYWRFNETAHAMDPNYPQNMERWRGVPTNLDAAMTWKDGLTYFFKGRLFWRFDNTLIITDDRYPLPTAQHWLGCVEEPDTIWW